MTATTDPGAIIAFRDRRAARTLHLEGLAHYEAGNLHTGEHVLSLLDMKGVSRTRWLLNGETYWWARGLAAGTSTDALLAAIPDEEMPTLVTPAEAAERIPHADGPNPDSAPMSRAGVRHNVMTGNLYPMYGERRVLWLFDLQVTALAAERNVLVAQARGSAGRTVAGLRVKADRARAAWFAMRAGFPPAFRIADLAMDVTPASGNPLAVPLSDTRFGQRFAALQVARKHGWCQLNYPIEGGGYLPTVGGEPVELPAEGILPWVLGRADAHGKGHLVAYRPGLA